MQRANGRQRRMRSHSRQLPLRNAVRSAVDVFFRFKYRSKESDALWCDTERLWMGSETFLHWSLWDASINLPWVVGHAAGVPTDADEFLSAVVAELNCYWDEQTTFLPRTGRPDWLPLP